MAAKVTPAAKSNARQAQRRAAVVLLNGLAAELGVRQISVKSARGPVEKLVRVLDARCRDGSLPARLRAAVTSYLNNSSTFSVSLLPAASGVDADACSADCDRPPPLQRHRLLDEGFRLESKAFMLTYNSRAFSPETWPMFLQWVKDKRQELGARRWAAWLEESENAQRTAASAAAAAAVFHVHAYLWWTDGQGLRRRNTDDLVFSGVRPRVDVCTCQATRGRPLQLAAAQGLWHVAQTKSGTISADTNFVAWRDYVPKAEWLRSLWDAHKLSHGMYETYSRQFRVGYADRKRELAELEADERRQAVRDHVATELAQLEAAGVFQPARTFPEVEAFLDCFRGGSRCRRPILAVVGGTNLGKSILAADVLRRVGEILRLPEFLEVTVESDAFLDLSDIDIRRHAGVLLDGVGDAEVLKSNREVLQGRPKLCKAARSPTMRFSSVYSLCRRAVVATFDLSAANLHMFESDHWLRNSKNVICLKLLAPAWVSAAAAAPLPEPGPAEQMRSWSVAGVVAFATARDLAGPASSLFASGVDGADLLQMDEKVLVSDVRLTAHLAEPLYVPLRGTAFVTCLPTAAFAASTRLRRIPQLGQQTRE